MDPFQQISHICRTAYNSGLLSPYHPCPGLLYPSFKASTIQTCFFFFFIPPHSAFLATAAPQLQLSRASKEGGRRDGDVLCVILTYGGFSMLMPPRVALGSLVRAAMAQTPHGGRREGEATRGWIWAAVWHSLGLIHSERGINRSR